MTENSKRVLLAEDDASMRRFIKVTLQNAGYAVTSAEDGLMAMQLFSDALFDAVVADAVMPNLSGYELSRLIRAQFPDRDIPFVMVSGRDEKAGDERFCDAFLTKDTNLKAELLAVLSKLIPVSCV
jgi:CheY-like chemotaxis protein